MKTKPFNPVDYLETREEIARYLNDAWDDDNPEVFIIALGNAMRAQGVSEIARRTGLNRESLYKVISGKAKPKWETVHALMKALGLHFDAVA